MPDAVRRGRRHGAAAAFAGSATALVLAGLVACTVSLLLVIRTPYEIVLPGPVRDVQQVVRPAPPHPSGALYLTTVYSDPANAAEWLYAKVSPRAGLVPRAEEHPSGIDDAIYQRLLAAMMDESKVAATVVALRAAGYDVAMSGQGAEVQAVAAGSATQGLLRAGDVIVAAGDAPVTTTNDLLARIQAHRPGETLRLEVERGDATVSVDVRLRESPDEPGRAQIGIVALTRHFAYHLPLDVTLDTSGIVGPSAGLMLALGVYESAAGQSLTGGRKIAGTGTISTDGSVGPVGGVPYKVAAAEAAGATLFLAPVDGYAGAAAAAHHMRVVRVDSFQAALDALRATPGA